MNKKIFVISLLLYLQLFAASTPDGSPCSTSPLIRPASIKQVLENMHVFMPTKKHFELSHSLVKMHQDQ